MRCEEGKRSDGTQELEVSEEVQMVSEEAGRAKVTRVKVAHRGLYEGSNTIRFIDSFEVRERVEGDFDSLKHATDTGRNQGAPGRNRPFRGALVGLIND